jgi:superfamily I DNA/RNA helicase
MAKIAISQHCLKRMPEFERRVRNKLDEVMGTFAGKSAQELRNQKGLHLERYSNSADDRARTVRITDNFRAILCDTGRETFVVHDILTHDEADRWMMRNTFRVNPASGAFEIIDLEAVDTATAALDQPSAGAEASLYEHRKDKDFTQLGVDPEWMPLLRRLTDEEQLLPLLGILPESQVNAIVQLVGEATVEEIYKDIAGSTKPEEIDTDDLEAALDRPASQEQFHVFATEQEVQDQLDRPFTSWRNYLHHSQRAIAYRETWNGPVRVTGGAGTGKTIVAIHRAKALAEQLDDVGGKPILFTTYTRNLASAIEDQLRQLGGQELLDKVDVVNVDKLANRFVRDSGDKRPAPIFGSDVLKLWDEIRLEHGLDEHSAAFLNSEWEQVILAAPDCTTRAQYFNIQRAGRGVPLDRRGRAKVWKAVELMMQRLIDDKRQTQLQLAEQARGHLERLNAKPYQHVIVDEAQDLHETQWRMLRSAVAEGANDMFIVGDSHQRIYDRRSSLGKCGIHIVGRSHKLKKNYRTTAQILGWALTMLGEGDFDDLDDGVEKQTFAGYHSVMSGPPPIMTGYGSAKKQLDAAAQQVQSWITDGIDDDDIGVAARTNASLASLAARLKEAGVKSETLKQELPKEDGVKLGTMHRLKGLEFRAVLVIDVDDETVPMPKALTSKHEDEVQHREDLQRERCLLYVAVTRARDSLAITWSGEPSRYLGAVLD